MSSGAAALLLAAVPAVRPAPPVSTPWANLAALPVALPMLAAIAMLLLHGRPAAQRWISAALAAALNALAALLLHLVRGGPLVLPVGNWPPPFAIVLAVDAFGAIMLCLVALVYAAFVAFSWGSMGDDPLDRGRQRHFYWPLAAFLMMGVDGSFATGDLFNLFVMFEITLISSYILLSLGGERHQLRETFKYTALNVVASTLFLVAVALLYAALGTVNMADVAVKAAAARGNPIIAVTAVMFLIVFGAKGAVFPLYFWLPRSYAACPTALSALFAGLLTKVGVYALIRVFTLIFPGDPGYARELVLGIAGFTMLFGVLGAYSQFDMKRILAYHIISQIGYMVMGLGLFSPLGLAGAIFHIAHNIVVKSCLFFVAGATERVTGTTDLHRMGGVSVTHPRLAALFLAAGLSIAGVPPLSGFFSKYALLQASVAEGRWLIAAVSLVTSLLTLLSMIKIYRYVFWGAPQGERRPARMGPLVAPVAGLVVISVAMGLGASWSMGLAESAATQLLAPGAYIRAVLGPGGGP